MRPLLIKKGQTGFEESLWVIATMFGVAIFVFILYFAYGQIKEPVSEGLTNAMSDGGATFNVTDAGDTTQSAIGFFSTLFPFFIFGLILFVAVSAMFIKSHPVFFFVSIVLLIIVIILGVVFANVYEEVSSDSNFGDTDSNLTVMHYVMKYLPWMAAIVIIVLMVIIFSNKSGGTTGL